MVMSRIWYVTVPSALVVVMLTLTAVTKLLLKSWSKECSVMINVGLPPH